jgi:undecaprenyl-diphosphatase
MTTPETPPPVQDREQVRRILEQELAQVDSPEAAEAIVERLEALTAGQMAVEKAEQAAAAPAASTVVERATQAGAPTDEAAAVLAETAARAVAPTPEASAVTRGAREVLGARPAPAPEPRTERGRSYLREAVLRRMGPLQAVDARIYLAINTAFPHPRWLNALVYLVTVLTTGGWIWSIAVLFAYLFRVRRSWRALRQLLPSVVGATWIVEYPIKEVFRRRRPFIDVVRALVVGRKPGSYSFPSGHTASSFASAWVLSTVWPRRSPFFFALASFVGFSRIYVGAHYPGDVGAGALFGMVLAELFRRAARRLLSSQ